MAIGSVLAVRIESNEHDMLEFAVTLVVQHMALSYNTHLLGSDKTIAIATKMHKRLLSCKR